MSPMFQQQLPLPLLNIQDLDVIVDKDARKNFVGNQIYPIIDGSFGNVNAGRITGMLLDEAVIDFKRLLTDQTYFTAKA